MYLALPAQVEARFMLIRLILIYMLNLKLRWVLSVAMTNTWIRNRDNLPTFRPNIYPLDMYLIRALLVTWEFLDTPPAKYMS